MFDRIFGLVFVSGGVAPWSSRHVSINRAGGEGDRIIFSGQSVEGSREEAQRFVDQLATGMRIPVRVSPVKPALSVIEPGFDPLSTVLESAFTG